MNEEVDDKRMNFLNLRSFNEEFEWKFMDEFLWVFRVGSKYGPHVQMV